MNRKEAQDSIILIEKRMIDLMIQFEPMGEMIVSDVKSLARLAREVAWREIEKLIENEGS